jgi:crotonobetainyl-CoA:carnitine CoA-transferase CaiB-like acyl-CoA transferase
MTTAQRKGPLSDFRVLDLAAPLGLHCTKLLADMGADVIKVEPPSGDESRRIPPFKDDAPHAEKSLYFLHFNTNKRSITLDVAKPDGRAIFLELARKADVLIETARPGGMDKLGLGYETLHAEHPGLIYAAITPFGQSGPWRNYKANDMAGIALGTLLYLAGEPGEPPLQPPGEIAYGMASTYGAFGIAVSLYHRLETGRGQYIDVSMHECAGHIISGPEFEKRSYLRQHPDIVTKAIAEFCAKYTKEELYDEGQKRRIAVTPINKAGEFIEMEQTKARELFVEMEHPVIGKYQQFGVVPRLMDTPGAIYRPAPLLGEHNDEIYRGELGMDSDDLAALRAAGVI